ncbi:NB-ARC domain-containing protein [Streptomyces sp. NPDC085596]|uniref:NB-ARC domain-containing protein n=1 Tax=Streptomyces sp. NPDC085596 TaxID=3365731 RepID=UPI0037D25EA0
MEAEMMALAAMCASSLMGLALQDLWGWGKKRFATLLDRGARGRHAPVEDELENLRQVLLDARGTGDEDAAQAAFTAWALRFEGLLAQHPEIADRARAVVGETIERSPAPVAFANIVHYVNNSAVLRAMNDHWTRCTAEHRMTAMFLCGLPGVGKRTTLRQWLQSRQDALPDEVLHADLSPDERGRPADLAAILERWLDELGVPRQDRPADLDLKAAELRRVLRRRPRSVLLENVTRLGQVRALLPDSPRCVLLMTGQQVPAALESLLDFEPVDVTPLRDDHALELLVKVSRSTESPERLRPIVRQLGGLPLAVRLVAGQLKTPVPGVLEDITARLADRVSRQELLTVDDAQNLPGALDTGYAHLAADAALLYRRLGVLPRLDLQMDSVLALLPDREPAAARRALQALVSARLVEFEGVDTYRMHPLVHDHAVSVAERGTTEAERAETEGWFVRHHLRTAESGEAALSSRWRYDPMNVYASHVRRPQSTYTERELGRRRAGLLAAVHLAHDTGLHSEAWRLCQGLWTFYLRTAGHAEWIESHEAGLASAERTGDPLATARMHYQLGFAHLDRWNVEEDDPRRAREHLEAALDHARPETPDRGEGERRTRSSALEGLGLLELKLKRPQHALARLDEAIAALDGVDHPRGLALLAYHRAPAYTALRRHDDAERTLREARERFTALGEGKDIALNIGKTWLRCAEDRRVRGQLDAAADAMDAAIAELPKAESAYTLAAAHLLRGDIHRDRGDRDRAAADWENARELFTAARSTRADEARERLAESADGGDFE